MGYPLGSFPRFGYQETWAEERRERAIANSIATRQARARTEFMVEQEAYRLMMETVRTLEPHNEQGAAQIAEIRRLMEGIQRRHDAGKRVYYRRLGEALQYLVRITGLEVGERFGDEDSFTRLAEALGRQRYEDNLATPPACWDEPVERSSGWLPQMDNSQWCNCIIFIVVWVLIMVSR